MHAKKPLTALSAIALFTSAAMLAAGSAPQSAKDLKGAIQIDRGPEGPSDRGRVRHGWRLQAVLGG